MLTLVCVDAHAGTLRVYKPRPLSSGGGAMRVHALKVPPDTRVEPRDIDIYRRNYHEFNSVDDVPAVS